jgi:uncharacterized membrane protein YccC
VIELIMDCVWQRYDKWLVASMLIMVTALVICSSLALENIVKNTINASILVFVVSFTGLVACVLMRSEIARMMLFTASVASFAMLGWSVSNSDYKVILIVIALSVVMEFSMVRYFIPKK